MKLLILDKDGTLVAPASGSKFPNDPQDQKLISLSVPQRISQYRALGYEVAIATNQGGVAAGHKTLDEAIDETCFAMDISNVHYAMMAHSYEEEGGTAIWIDKTDGGQLVETISSNETKFRKPAPGMISTLAVRICGKQQGKLLFVGDMNSDLQAAVAAGAEFMWAHEWLRQYPND